VKPLHLRQSAKQWLPVLLQSLKNPGKTGRNLNVRARKAAEREAKSPPGGHIVRNLKFYTSVV